MCHNVKPNLSTVQGCEGTLAISYKYHFPENSPETIRSVRCGVVVLRPGRLRWMCETIPSALSTAPTDFVRDVQTPADFAFRCIWKSWLKQGEGSGAPCIDKIIREGVDQGSRTRMSANTSEGTESEWKWHIYKMDQDGGSQKFLLNDLPPHLNMSEPAPNRTQPKSAPWGGIPLLCQCHWRYWRFWRFLCKMLRDATSMWEHVRTNRSTNSVTVFAASRLHLFLC